MNKNDKYVWVDYVAISIVVLAFFVISYCGFFVADDFTMAYRNCPSIIDVIKNTMWFYLHLGGRFFSVAAQYLFSGRFGDNRLWFDVVNTCFFVLFILVCGKLIGVPKRDNTHCALLFVLLFWFLCPFPWETLFWVGGSTTYLWANVLVFGFLLFFLKYKDDDFSVVAKTGLLVMSVFAATEFISCASVCGAFVVYYAFHIKSFKGNAVPLVVGFAIGSILVLFAPGNFERAAMETNASFLDRMHSLLSHPIQEILNYKVLWLFLIAIIWIWIRDKEFVRGWVKSNSILLLSLGWSVVAFSIVFRPSGRALFFTETLSMILLLRFLIDVFRQISFPERGKKILNRIYRPVLILAFCVFLVDAYGAIHETKTQSNNNDRLLAELKDAGGQAAIDLCVSTHRMAIPPIYPDYSWKGIAYELGVDSVQVFPYYCQDKYYKNSQFGENVYVDKDGLIRADYIEGTLDSYGIIFIRSDEKQMEPMQGCLSLTIKYCRPYKWYKALLHKGYRSDNERVVNVMREQPDVNILGYNYYIVWMKKENLANLKSIDVAIN